MDRRVGGSNPRTCGTACTAAGATPASLHRHLTGGIGYGFVGRIPRAMSEFFDIVGSIVSLNPVKLIITHVR
jgi:hypothetical protein